MKMLDPGFCSPRFLLPFREESGDEELSVLPRHTKVIVTGNNRTKSVLVGLQGVVKKAVGLGGWHWLVLKNGVEVKLQRNALSVLEPPTGNEEDEDDFHNSSSGSDINEKDNGFSSGIEFSKIRKPKVKYTRPFVSSMSAKSINDSSYKEVQSNNKTSHQDLDHLQSIGELERSSPIPEMRNMPSIRGIKRVNLAKLGTSSLWRYWRHFKLGHANPNISREQLVNTVQQHFASWRVDEFEVITEFIHASKRLKSAERE